MSSHMPEDSENKYVLSSDNIQKMPDGYHYDKSIAPDTSRTNMKVNEEHKDKNVNKKAMNAFIYC